MSLYAADVTAVIPTRGDCDLEPIMESLIFDNVVVWSNRVAVDMGAYGRYVGMRNHANRKVVYTQDDDCIVRPEDQWKLLDAYEPGVLTALMPAERIDYVDTVLIGWGSIFDRDLPEQAFRRWFDADHPLDEAFRVVGADFVFPMLSTWKRIDAQHIDLPHAHAENRTWASWPHYADVKNHYLREARALRDGK